MTKHSSPRSVILLLLLGLWSAAGEARADSVTLPAVADTFIAQSFPDRNYGAAGFFNSGTTQSYTTNRGLLRFDPAAAIPAGAKILSAALTTEVTHHPSDPDAPWNSANFGLHRLLRDWGEGDNFATKPNNSTAAGTNEANWSYRFAFTTATWGVPGGQSGVDYVPGPSATMWVYESGVPAVFNATPALAADVQTWLDNPGTNFGWMLIVQNETTDLTARRFGSRESGLDAPHLDVTFQPPPPVDQAVVTNGQFRLTFTPLTNYIHQVQSRADLKTGSWQSLTNVGPFSNGLPVVVTDSLGAAQRFYRLTLP